MSELRQDSTGGLAGAIVNCDKVAPLVRDEAVTLQLPVPERRSAR